MLEIIADQKLSLPAAGSWPKTVHIFDERSQWAVNAALAAARPLLVRGEPGCGKSQLARAAALRLKRAFIPTVVHPGSESRDLLWDFDAVGRLGEAQALGAMGTAAADPKEILRASRFLAPGPLWLAFDWNDAKRQERECGRRLLDPWLPKGWRPDQGCVLLIDEIDKADSDLPNGLLEIMGNGAFQVPFLQKPIGMASGAPAPLVIVTTNEERELPAAFLRRCLVLHLAMPEDEAELIDFLVKRGEAHFGNHCGETVRRLAAEQLCRDRRAARDAGQVAPGQAEYLDLLQAVWRLAEDLRRRSGSKKFNRAEEQTAILRTIGEFALVKQKDATW